MTTLDTSDMDPELARYLNRNYWEQKQETGGGASSEQGAVKAATTSTTQPSAPAAAANEVYSTAAGRTEEVRGFLD